MAVTSYSQVGEDLQIAFMLGDARNARYIDVGCLWPVEHSNSYYFYERGGQGLCIDPNPDVVESWAQERPRDVFFSAGVSDRADTLTYVRHGNPVFNTFSPERAAQVQRRANGRPGRAVVGRDEVRVLTLDAIVAETGFAEACDGRLDFLSIDVEGLEDQVLAGYSFALRPRVVVCEHVRAGGRAAVETTPVFARLSELGYVIGAFTGHDVFFVDASR